jgi:hypothetical protein
MERELKRKQIFFAKILPTKQGLAFEKNQKIAILENRSN